MTEHLVPLGPVSALGYFQHLHDGGWSGPALLLGDHVRFQAGSADSTKLPAGTNTSTRDQPMGVLAQTRSYWQVQSGSKGPFGTAASLFRSDAHCLRGRFI